MAKKHSELTQARTELLIPRKEAEQQLHEQMEAGREIISIDFSRQEDLDKAKMEYEKWVSFNTELLNHIFSNNKLSDEFIAWSTRQHKVLLREKQFSEKLSDFEFDLTEKINRIDSIIHRLKLFVEPPTTTPQPSSTIYKPELKKSNNKIFIVHGHDNEVKIDTARFLEKLGFKPIILHEQASGGKTIIEKIEEHTDVSFSVVLYTPCDKGKSQNAEELKDRARQNVVFEHGYLIGRLGRKNVCALIKGEVEEPSDIDGIIYIPLDNEEWKMKLAKEMKKAGLNVDFNKLFE